jgi:hypothetical protein
MGKEETDKGAVPEECLSAVNMWHNKLQNIYDFEYLLRAAIL